MMLSQQLPPCLCVHLQLKDCISTLGHQNVTYIKRTYMYDADRIIPMTHQTTTNSLTAQTKMTMRNVLPMDCKQCCLPIYYKTATRYKVTQTILLMCVYNIYLRLWLTKIKDTKEKKNKFTPNPSNNTHTSGFSFFELVHIWKCFRYFVPCQRKFLTGRRNNKIIEKQRQA